MITTSLDTTTFHTRRAASPEHPPGCGDRAGSPSCPGRRPHRFRPGRAIFFPLGRPREAIPPQTRPAIGTTFRADGFIDGRINITFRGTKPFLLSITPDGIHVTATFAKDAPLFIPWTSVRDISCVEALRRHHDHTHARQPGHRPVQSPRPGDARRLEQCAAPHAVRMETLADLLANRLRGGG